MASYRFIRCTPHYAPQDSIMVSIGIGKIKQVPVIILSGSKISDLMITMIESRLTVSEEDSTTDDMDMIPTAETETDKGVMAVLNLPNLMMKI